MYWKYRAFDESLVAHEGVLSTPPNTTDADAANRIVLLLRQQGLQCMSLESISLADYRFEARLQRLRRRAQSLGGGST
jgi:hypothetical protein